MNPIMKILITSVLVVALIPVVIQLFIGVDTSGWDPAIVTLWELLPLIAVVTVLILFIGIGIARHRGAFALIPVWAIPVPMEYVALAMVPMAAVAIWYIGRTHVRAAQRLESSAS